jgi:type VI secretion system protein ImpA
MAPLDLSAGLPDLDPDSPTGPNLELDADFGALERATQGAPEKQYGDTIIPAVEPEWQEVADLAGALLERTRDLRVLGHLAVAELHLSGLAGFVGVLAMIRQLLESRWGLVHPQLDPEDDNDPTLRANALLQLKEPVRVLRVIRDMPIAMSRRDGPVSWRTIGLSTGAIEAEEGQDTKPEISIRSAFAETDYARLSALRQAAAAGVQECAAIGAVFDANAGPGTGPDLDDLLKLLRDIERHIATYAVEHPAPEAPEEAVAESEAVGTVADAPTPRRAGGAAAASVTAVTNRADALRLLDLVCRYFEENEPSSPLPLLIGRARKLADKGFLEILQDLAPEGLSQAQTIVQSREM